jgi:hypothetical protein
MSALVKMVRSLRFLILIFSPIKAITRITFLALLYRSWYDNTACLMEDILYPVNVTTFSHLVLATVPSANRNLCSAHVYFSGKNPL